MLIRCWGHIIHSDICERAHITLFSLLMFLFSIIKGFLCLYIWSIRKDIRMFFHLFEDKAICNSVDGIIVWVNTYNKVIYCVKFGH